MNPRRIPNPLKESFQKFMLGKQPASTQTIDISNGEVFTLTVPEDATNAVVVLEFTEPALYTIGGFGGKYTTNGSTPQLTGYLMDENTGITLGEYVPVILDTVEKMEDFKVIANDLGIRHKAIIKVSYFE